MPVFETSFFNHLANELRAQISSHLQNDDLLSWFQINKKNAAFAPKYWKKKTEDEFYYELVELKEAHKKSGRKEPINYRQSYLNFQNQINQNVIKEKYKFYLEILNYKGGNRNKKLKREDLVKLYRLYLTFKSTPLYWLRSRQKLLNTLFNKICESGILKHDNMEMSTWVGRLNQINIIKDWLQNKEYSKANEAFIGLCEVGYTASVIKLLKMWQFFMPVKTEIILLYKSFLKLNL